MGRAWMAVIILATISALMLLSAADIDSVEEGLESVEEEQGKAHLQESAGPHLEAAPTVDPPEDVDCLTPIEPELSHINQSLPENAMTVMIFVVLSKPQHAAIRNTNDSEMSSPAENEGQVSTTRCIPSAQSNQKLCLTRLHEDSMVQLVACDFDNPEEQAWTWLPDGRLCIAALQQQQQPSHESHSAAGNPYEKSSICLFGHARTGTVRLAVVSQHDLNHSPSDAPGNHNTQFPDELTPHEHFVSLFRWRSSSEGLLILQETDSCLDSSPSRDLRHHFLHLSECDTVGVREIPWVIVQMPVSDMGDYSETEEELGEEGEEAALSAPLNYVVDEGSTRIAASTWQLIDGRVYLDPIERLVFMFARMPVFGVWSQLLSGLMTNSRQPEPAHCFSNCAVKPMSTNRNITLSCGFQQASASSTMISITTTPLYFWRQFSSAGIVCPLPDHISVTEEFTPSLSINNNISLNGSFPVLVLPRARLDKHLFCACLVIWNRYEFLLEWLTYHTRVHGLAHTIIISQDTDTVNATAWLSTFYSLQTVYWPERETQPAMQAHCALLASRQCQWVSQWDVDEFLLKEDGKTMKSLLSQVPSNVAMLVLKKAPVQMFDTQRTILRTPPGGVLRHYYCTYDDHKAPKSLVRLSGVHASYVNTVHLFCAKKGFLRRNIKTTLAHYTVQSWDLFRLKLMRSANSFRKTNETREFELDEPSIEYLNETQKCKRGLDRSTSAARSLLWERMSWKVIPSQSALVLITGTYGENTILGRLLTYLPKQILTTHRVAAHLGLRSILADSFRYNTHKANTKPAFSTIIRVLTDPLKSINRLAHLSDWTLANNLLPLQPRSKTVQPLTPLRKALYYWVAVSQLLDMFSDVDVRVEDFPTRRATHNEGNNDNDQTAHLRFLSLYSPLKLAETVQAESTASMSTWAALSAADMFMTKVACAMSTRYGYPCNFFDEQPSD